MRPDLWVGCGVIVVNDDEEILIVEEGRGLARGRWSFPAGKLEKGERLTDAAVREAEEETGLTVELIDLLGVYHSPRTVEDTYGVNFVFRAHAIDGEIRPSEEHPQVRFASRSEVAGMVATDRFRSGELISAILSDLDAGRSHPLHFVTALTARSPGRVG